MSQITFHRVSADERLSGIAALHGVHVQDIVAANPHKPRLQLPSGAVVFASLGAGEDIALPALYLEPGVLGTDPTATTNLASAVTRLKTMAIVIRTVEGGVAGAILGAIAGAVKGDAALKGGAIGAAGGALLAGVVTAVMLSGSPKPT